MSWTILFCFNLLVYARSFEMPPMCTQESGLYEILKNLNRHYELAILSADDALILKNLDTIKTVVAGITAYIGILPTNEENVTLLMKFRKLLHDVEFFAEDRAMHYLHPDKEIFDNEPENLPGYQNNPESQNNPGSQNNAGVTENKQGPFMPKNKVTVKIVYEVAPNSLCAQAFGNLTTFVHKEYAKLSEHEFCKVPDPEPSQVNLKNYSTEQQKKYPELNFHIVQHDEIQTKEETHSVNPEINADQPSLEILQVLLEKLLKANSSQPQEFPDKPQNELQIAIIRVQEMIQNATDKAKETKTAVSQDFNQTGGAQSLKLTIPVLQDKKMNESISVTDNTPSLAMLKFLLEKLLQVDAARPKGEENKPFDVIHVAIFRIQEMIKNATNKDDDHEISNTEQNETGTQKPPTVDIGNIDFSSILQLVNSVKNINASDKPHEGNNNPNSASHQVALYKVILEKLQKVEEARPKGAAKDPLDGLKIAIIYLNGLIKNATDTTITNENPNAAFDINVLYPNINASDAVKLPVPLQYGTTSNTDGLQFLILHLRDLLNNATKNEAKEAEVTAERPKIDTTTPKSVPKLSVGNMSYFKELLKNATQKISAAQNGNKNINILSMYNQLLKPNLHQYPPPPKYNKNVLDKLLEASKSSVSKENVNNQNKKFDIMRLQELLKNATGKGPKTNTANAWGPKKDNFFQQQASFLSTQKKLYPVMDNINQYAVTNNERDAYPANMQEKTSRKPASQILQEVIETPRKNDIIELTYIVKRPKPMIYQPYYYIKYVLPYKTLLQNLETLMKDNPQLISDKLYQQLVQLSKITDISPDLKPYGKEDILKIVFDKGSLVNAVVVPSKENSGESASTPTPYLGYK